MWQSRSQNVIFADGVKKKKKDKSEFYKNVCTKNVKEGRLTEGHMSSYSWFSLV